jgi:hypothetical protein
VNGNVIQQFGLHTDTHFQPDWTAAKVVPTNNGGIVVARAIFGGYNVTLMFARVNGVGDDLAQFLEDNWEAGQPDPSVSMLETVYNTDGSVNQYNYINGTILPKDGGSFKGVSEVSGTYDFFFPQRQSVGAATNLTLGNQGLS